MNLSKSAKDNLDSDSPLTDIPKINRQRLLERFLRYVKVDTAADPNASTYPSSQGQLELGKALFEELSNMGASEVVHDENGIVTALIPSTVTGEAPVVALVAHLDTSPEAPSENVQPQVIESYKGGDIALPSGNVITVSGCRDLEGMIGDTLVTTDGTTLLGGDDKAGVAIIMELAECLIENTNIAHGPVRVVMTCDEEIGHGTDKIDLDKIGAMVAYTVDGGSHGMIDVETFSADAMTVTFTGHNIHPALAKDRMINSIRAAASFIDSLPKNCDTPETTDDRDGFIHAYDMIGGVGETRIELLLRSFETEKLSEYAQQTRKLAEQAAQAHLGTKVECQVREQYRNLREGLNQLPEAVDLAERAFSNLGKTFSREIVRGGTDGSQLTEKGLPTPNLSSGQHNIHSLLEFANLNEMESASEHLIEMLKLWSEKRC